MESGREAVRVIYEEWVSDDGFLRSLRTGKIDESRFDALIAAIKELERLTCEPTRTIDRLVVTCLFEVPYEVENTSRHYEKVGRDAASRVDMMAQLLRNEINQMLGKGVHRFFSDGYQPRLLDA
jgi:hypothetical protein